MEEKIRTIRGYYPPAAEWPDIPKNTLQEGKISFTMVSAENIYDAPAFFNPVMVLNRDLAILFVKLYSDRVEQPIRVFEPLAGIGIRALRMAKEIPKQVSELIINDYGDISSKIASYNIQQLNLEGVVFQFKREARSLALELAEQQFRYHFIDLDPFGPPTPFIDSMWSLMPLRSMIAVTATDMQALCGVFPRSCQRKYGGLPLNNHHTHETASRIMIGMVVRSAARFERGVEPVFTSSVDHYTKVFFKVRYQRGAANNSVEQIGFSYTCDTCNQIDYITGDAITHNCCGSTTKRAGPLWVGELFDAEWCQLALDSLEELQLPSHRRIEKLLLEGVESVGLKGYFSMDEIGRKLRITLPSFKKVHQALEEKGYRCVKTRFNKNCIRTDCDGVELMNTIKDLVS